MAHQVIFEQFGILQQFISQAEVRDLIDVLFKGRDSCFRISGRMPKGKEDIRGLYTFLPLEGVHSINLKLEAITRSVGLKWTCGGNHPAPGIRLAIAMVIAHEIQHANQTIDPHAPVDNGKRYKSRVHEIDARRSVDENIEVISKVMGEPVPYGVTGPSADREEGPDLRAIADDLRECQEVTVDDIRAELRSANANNPKNMQSLKGMLKRRGVKVVQ